MKFNPFLLIILTALLFASCKNGRFQNFNKQKYLKGKLAQKFDDSMETEGEELSKDYQQFEEYSYISEEFLTEEEVFEEVGFSKEYQEIDSEIYSEVYSNEHYRTAYEEIEVKEKEAKVPTNESIESNLPSRDFQTEISLFFYTVICVLAVLCFFLIALVYTFVLGPWVFLVALGLSAIAIVLAIVLHVYDFDFMSGILAWYLYSLLMIALASAFGITLWAIS